jgi:hypothetical protein
MSEDAEFDAKRWPVGGVEVPPAAKARVIPTRLSHRQTGSSPASPES